MNHWRDLNDDSYWNNLNSLQGSIKYFWTELEKLTVFFLTFQSPELCSFYFRAVYQDADIYLLDDPLSAVDAEVGKQLFEQWVATCCLLIFHFFQNHLHCNFMENVMHANCNRILSCGKCKHTGYKPWYKHRALFFNSRTRRIKLLGQKMLLKEVTFEEILIASDGIFYHCGVMNKNSLDWFFRIKQNTYMKKSHFRPTCIQKRIQKVFCNDLMASCHCSLLSTLWDLCK